MAKKLEVKNLYYNYPAEKKSILGDISFEVEENEFFSIVGPSGCGKTTLALTLNGLIPKSLGGHLEGNIRIDGKDIKKTGTAELSQKVQILFQSPESQLFALNVQDEISFGLENLNIEWEKIEKNVNESLEKLDIEDLRSRSIEELSSGQKQKVALASVLAMKPDILILDEPTANLDPKAVKDFLNILKELKGEMTVILIEHDMDFVEKFSDRIMLMDSGHIVNIDNPKKMFKDKKFLKIMDPPQKKKQMGRKLKRKEKEPDKEKVLEIKNLNFKYKNKVPALKNINLEVGKGELFGILGLNGSGKSTLALNIIGLLEGKGGILFKGEDLSGKDVYKRTKNIGYVFQNPHYQLFEDNVYREISFGPKNIALGEKEVEKRVDHVLNVIGLNSYKKEDPHSLSVGQMKRVTIASILAMKPEVIIVDEPDTGLDYRTAKKIMDHIKKLKEEGKTIILISHNLQLVADYCDRVVYLEEGEVKPIERFLEAI